jgi:hypothetical protein
MPSCEWCRGGRRPCPLPTRAPHAHCRAQRVVHRDVKPSNVLLAQPLVAGPRAGRSKRPPRSPPGPGLGAAHWALADLGSAAELAPAVAWVRPGDFPWAVLPVLKWEAQGPAPYETPAYSPPEVRCKARGAHCRARENPGEQKMFCLHRAWRTLPLPSLEDRTQPAPTTTSPPTSGPAAAACLCSMGCVVPGLHAFRGGHRGTAVSGHRARGSRRSGTGSVAAFGRRRPRGCALAVASARRHGFSRAAKAGVAV